MMRICIPIHSFAPGGVERVALRLAEAWQAAGADVTVVLGRATGATRDEAPRLRYVTRREPFSTARWETAWLIWHLWRTLRRQDADMIFCAGNTYTVVCAAMKLLLQGRCPPVVVKISNALDRRDMALPLRLAYRLWLRLQGRLFDRFIATAPPMAAESSAALGLGPARIASIANPILRADQIELLQRAEQSDRGSGRRFLAIGRLEPQKNYPLMLAAFARIARADDRLTIAGEGQEKARIEAAIVRLALEGQVVLRGHVHDVAPLLRRADVLVLSSDYEGVPGAVIEALAAGCAIAATDCCASMRWLLGDGQFGSLANVGDSMGLAAAMGAAADLAPPIDSMAAFARHFTIEHTAPEYLALFETVRREASPCAERSVPPSDTLHLRDRNAVC